MAKIQEAKVETKIETKELVLEPAPKPVGWFVVTFPNVNDTTVHMESWLDTTLDWIRMRDIRSYSWTFLHGLKKESDRISPIFYFRNQIDAARMMWRFSGVLQ